MAGYPKEIVEQSRQERAAFTEGYRSCPHCGELGLLACGGPGSYWIEHSCGAYSKLSATLEEAYASEWELIGEDMNGAMIPPVGG